MFSWADCYDNVVGIKNVEVFKLIDPAKNECSYTEVLSIESVVALYVSVVVTTTVPQVPAAAMDEK